MALKLTLAVALLAICCAAQQQFDGNYVEEYDYDNSHADQQGQRPVQRPAQNQRPLAPIRASTPRPTPVPILKQINRHNEDGSYTYGYEGADGTFKIETKFPTGDVKGKYGFVDDTGKVRVVEYGADRYGFQPAGEGITVAPPTLVDETTKPDDLPEEDGFYQERPKPRPQKPQRVQRPQQSRPAPPPPPPPQFQQDNFDIQTRFVNEPSFAAPAPARSQSPTPPRPAIVPGAAPVQHSAPAAFAPSHPQPAPQRAFQPSNRQQFGPQQFAVASIRPGPQVHRAAPPQPQQPRFALQQAAPSQPARAVPAGGLLDRLAKDYALPAGAGAPLHDISFGYY